MSRRTGTWLRRAWQSPPEPPPFGAWILDPLSMLYQAAIALRPPVRPRRAPIPIVSVGSIWSGGAGKTPLAAFLARLAREEGMVPAILLRGYRGKVRRGAERVPSPPGPGDASRFGDEGCLHARIADAAVYVSPDRQSAAIRASRDGCRVAILDDGMQHRRLSRDIEIVSLPAESPLGNGRLLPRGPLREGPRALARADLIVLAHAPGRTSFSSRPRIPWVRPDVRILSWHDRITIVPLVSGGPAPSPGERVVLLCGIARPDPFRVAVEEAGYPVAAVEAFPDHHSFSRVECEAVRERAARLGVRWILTTTKDAERLSGIVGLGEPTIAVAALMIVWNEADAEALLRSRLHEIVRL